MQKHAIQITLWLFALLIIDQLVWQGTITAELAVEVGEGLQAARWKLVNALPR